MSEKSVNTAENNEQNLSKKENGIMAIKYLFCTSGAGIIQAVSFAIMNEVNDKFGTFNFLPEKLINNDYGLFYFIALFLSVVFNFTVNRKFTFKSANNVPIAMLKVFGYYCVFTPASIWWGTALTNIGWNEYLVLAITMLINLITEFTFQRFVVFKNSINTAEKK